MINIGDLKWIAGFLEGEGSFSISKGSIRVQASQMKKWPLDKLNLFLPGKIHPVHSKNKQWGSKEYWLWDLNVMNSAALMMTIYPLMSPHRQNQIKQYLILWKKQKRRNPGSPFCQRGHRKDENTYIYPNGNKCCSACRKKRMHEYYQRNKNNPIYKKRWAEASLKWRKNHPEKAIELSKRSNQKRKELLQKRRENICIS
jgi:hypothetical protein